MLNLQWTCSDYSRPNKRKSFEVVHLEKQIFLVTLVEPKSVDVCYQRETQVGDAGTIKGMTRGRSENEEARDGTGSLCAMVVLI